MMIDANLQHMLRGFKLSGSAVLKIPAIHEDRYLGKIDNLRFNLELWRFPLAIGENFMWKILQQNMQFYNIVTYPNCKFIDLALLEIQLFMKLILGENR